MGFNGQANIFFSKITSCTCNVHIKLDILNPSNISFFAKWLKNEYFTFSPFLQNFKTFNFLYNLIFHQVHPMNMYFHKRGHVLL
jgi:hypothetical protein